MDEIGRPDQNSCMKAIRREAHKKIEKLDETNPEMRKAEKYIAINVVKENIFIYIQYGSWSKIIRIIGWVVRICFNLKARK